MISSDDVCAQVNSITSSIGKIYLIKRFGTVMHNRKYSKLINTTITIKIILVKEKSGITLGKGFLYNWTLSPTPHCCLNENKEKRLA